jgi:hypothetical protein
MNVERLTNLFADYTNQEAFFCQSTIFARAHEDMGLPPFPDRPKKEREMSAKLHTLYGVPLQAPKRTQFRPLYPYACSVVYDLRNYTRQNFWGPYKNDGAYTVDWERLEAVLIVLGHNLDLFTENMPRGILRPLWSVPWSGASPYSQPMPPMEARDVSIYSRGLLFP